MARAAKSFSDASNVYSLSKLGEVGPSLTVDEVFFGGSTGGTILDARAAPTPPARGEKKLARGRGRQRATLRWALGGWQETRGEMRVTDEYARRRMRQQRSVYGHQEKSAAQTAK